MSNKHTEDLQSSGGTWPSTLPNMPPTLSRPGIEAAETLLGLLRSALAMLIGPAAPLALPPCRCCRASAPGIAPTEAPVELAVALKSFFLRRHTHSVSTVPCQAISSCSSQTCQECNPETFFFLRLPHPLTLPLELPCDQGFTCEYDAPPAAVIFFSFREKSRGKKQSATACARPGSLYFGSCKKCCVRKKRVVTHFRRRLSWRMQSTLSQRQFPQGKCSTTSHRTLRALQEAHARGARRFVTLLALSALSFVSAVEPVRFLACASAVDEMEAFFAFAVVSFTSVRLSAGPSPGVETDSEREWNSASLFAIVYGGGVFCRRVGHFFYECIGSQKWWPIVGCAIRMYKGVPVVSGLGPLSNCLLLFLSQCVDRTGWC